MSQPGIGAMIHMLGGGSQHSSSEYIGKVIAALKVDNNRLKIDFTDGKSIEIWDDGQSCCENRYMVCDDELGPFVGAQWVSAELRDGPTETGEYGDEHECQFVIVTTSNGSFTLANHNEHNGYYGGFGMTITEPE